VGDSLLKSTEVPNCQPDRESQEVCCFLGAKVQDVTERVPQFIKSTDYHPLLLFDIGTNDTASQNVGIIQEDFRAPRVKVKSFGAQVIFSSILTVGGRGTARNRRIKSNNSWLHDWCHCDGLGFYDNGKFFNDYSLLERDGTHLLEKARGSLATG